ncbi:hypothetical protein HU200_049005 [Digitaria exilis]|uniref:Uncharacterized protein n=1 Tax=Digitaria exilis TaxID=1010633 RepID=A0A835AW19_9POAL|nr:hypothetical protein HU200_049005 [Digitaria exilis]
MTLSFWKYKEEQHGDGRLKYWVYFLCDFARLNAYDIDRQLWFQVPRIIKDACPMDGYKDSIAMGRNLLVFFKGKGVEHTQFCQFKYTIEHNYWSWAPPMNCPRSLFGSASVGHKAYLAGGIDYHGTVLSSAETYDCLQKRLDPLPSMNRARMLCSGVFMDGKVYVIGGKGSNNEELTCGEEYDFESWRVIEKMTEGLHVRVKSFGAPPLVAVVNNELYGADYIEKNVKKYDKKNNRWITLGRWPESITSSSRNGWGICFKACGEQLIMIGWATVFSTTWLSEPMVELYSWVPDGRPPAWNLIASKRGTRGSEYHAAVISC